MPITIRVNGRDRYLDDSSSVLDLLRVLEIRPRAVIVERNRHIVDKDSFGQVPLENGDIIEIIGIVSGG